MSEAARRFHVTGRVQGVWFRASTRRTAEGLGLRGSAVNLADGRVEVIAAGDPDSLASLERWLWQGPVGANVTDVVAEDWSDPVPAGFRTG